MDIIRIMWQILFVLLFISCGKSDSDLKSCKPQAIAIADCVVEKFEENPNEFLIETYRKECEQKYPLDICYHSAER